MLKKLIAAGVVGMATMAAHAMPVNGGFSVAGGVLPLPDTSINLATGLDFDASGTAEFCAGDIATVIGAPFATCNGATSVVKDIAEGTLVGEGAVAIAVNLMDWIQLSLGGVKFDLLGVTNITRLVGAVPAIIIQGTGTMYATGYDNTAGFFTLSTQGSQDPGNGTFSFSSTQISAGTVPEPGSLALIGIALVGLGFARRRKT